MVLFSIVFIYLVPGVVERTECNKPFLRSLYPSDLKVLSTSIVIHMLFETKTKQQKQKATLSYNTLPILFQNRSWVAICVNSQLHHLRKQLQRKSDVKMMSTNQTKLLSWLKCRSRALR